jgi:RNA polymerase sigma-54 factor
MSNQIKYSQTQKNSQKFSQLQIQQLHVLQMSNEELSAFVETELETNPFLEVGEQFISNPYDFDLILSYTSSTKSLQQELMEQLLLIEIDFDASVFEYLIFSLDSNGYLQLTQDEINDLDQNEFETALSCLQSLEPAGVGARSLQECLSIQLNRENQTEITDLAFEIVANSLSLLANKKWNDLCNKHQVDFETLKKASDFIKSLNPKPASIYSVTSEYIDPDVIIKHQDSEFVIELKDKKYYHLTLMTEMELDSEYNEYKRVLSNRAKNLMKSITKRCSTLFDIMQWVVQIQEDYFLNGGLLKPMTLMDIAEKLELSESTISRSINEKYLEYNDAIMKFSDLFSRRIQEDVSVDFIKNSIKELICKEDKSRPISDREIQTELCNKGIEVSRSGIAKYRQQMGILSTYQRKA